MQVMYVRDVRVSIPVCKDLKINIKTLKSFAILLFFKVFFRPFGLLTLCHHTTKFCSLSASIFYLLRGSHPEFLCKKGILINFTKFTGKNILAQVFSCEFSEVSKSTYFTEHFQWLLLSFI